MCEYSYLAPLYFSLTRLYHPHLPKRSCLGGVGFTGLAVLKLAVRFYDWHISTWLRGGGR